MDLTLPVSVHHHIGENRHDNGHEDYDQQHHHHHQTATGPPHKRPYVRLQFCSRAQLHAGVHQKNRVSRKRSLADMGSGSGGDTERMGSASGIVAAEGNDDKEPNTTTP